MTAGGTLSVGGAITVGTASGTWTRGTGTVILTATATLPATIFTSFNNLTVSAGTTTLGVGIAVNGVLTVGLGATLNTSAANNYAVTLNGDFSNSGTFTANGSAITIGGGAAQSIAGFTTTGTVSMTKTAGTATFTGNVNGGALTINGTSGTLNLGVGLTNTFTGTWTRTGGTLNGGSSTLNLSRAGAVTSGTGGTFTAGTGTVNYNYAAPQIIAAVAYNNLVFSGGGAKSIATGTSVTGNLSIAPTGSATASVVAGFNMAVGSLTLGGVTQIPGTWGSTTATSAANHNNTYFAATTGYVTVAGGATKLVFTALPGSPTAGTAFSVTVQSQDALGNPANLASATTITLSQASGGGTLSGTLTGSIVSGANSVTIATPVYSKSDTMTLTATASGGVTLTAVTSGNIVFSAGAVTAAQSTVAAAPTSVTADGSTTSTVTVTLKDANSNPVSGKTVTLAKTSGPGTPTITTVSGTTDASGLATFTVKSITAGADVFTATDTTDSVTVTQTATVTFTAGAATKLVYTTVPGTGTAGTAFSVTVQSQDAYGNPANLASATTITLSIATGGGTLSGTLTGSIGIGVNSVTIATPVYSKSDTMTLTATASGGVTLTAVTSGNIVFSAGAASKLAFTTQPGGGTGGSAFSTQPAVALEDQYGNTVTGTPQDVTLAIWNNAGPGGTLSGAKTVAVNTSTGVATFSGLSIDKAGTGYTLTATGSTVDTSAGVVVSSAFNITVGAAAKLAFTTQPGGGTVSAAWSQQPVVAVEDAGGNTVTSSSASVTLTIKIGTPACGGPGTLSGTTTLGASSGVATFSGLSINAVGTGYELHATSPGLTAVDSSPFNIAGSPVTFNFTLSDSAGDAASGQLVATNNGNNIFTVFSGFYDGTAGGVLGTYTLYPNPTPPGSTTSPAGAFIYDDQLLPSADPKLNNSGLLFTSGTTEVNLWGGDANGNPTPGVYSLYSSGGHTYQFSGNLTLTLLQSAAARLAFTTQPGNGTGGSAFSTQPAVTLQDLCGNAVTGTVQTVTVAIWNNAGGGTLSGTATAAVDPNTGVATFSGLSIDKIGTGYTLTATGSTVDTMAGVVVSGAFNVTVGAAAQLAFTTAAVTTTAGVASGNITVQRQDAGGNPVTTESSTRTVTLTSSSSGTVTFNPTSLSIANGSSSASFTYTDTKAGTPTITAASTSPSTITSATQQETVNAAAASQLVVTTQPSASTVAGVAFATQPVVKIEDAFGNVVTSGADSTVSVALTLTTGTGSLTGTATMNAVAGVADFTGNGLNINLVGTNKVLTATATVVAGTKTTTTSPAFAITPGAINHFTISAISSPQTVGTAFIITTITAQDVNNNTATNFASTVAYSGTAGITGTSGAFTLGVLNGARVTPTVAGSSLTVTVNDGAGHTGSATITTVNKGSTSVVVASSENPSGYKDSVPFTATLPAAATGNVVFLTNGAAFGSAVTLSSGSATSTATTLLPRGTNTITAQYAGDGNYLGSTNNLSGGQVVTNHPPVAAPMTVERTAGLRLKIAWSDVTTNWSDSPDGDTVTLTSMSLVTTNLINLTTNSTFILYTNSPNVNDQITYTISDGQGGTNTGVINVVINPFVTGQNATVTVSNDMAIVKFYGIPTYIYVTQRSTNLVNWVSIATNTVPTNGVINVTDNFSDLGGNIPISAFYRLGWSP
jgi:hypothetical protein